MPVTKTLTIKGVDYQLDFASEPSDQDLIEAGNMIEASAGTKPAINPRQDYGGAGTTPSLTDQFAQAAKATIGVALTAPRVPNLAKRAREAAKRASDAEFARKAAADISRESGAENPQMQALRSRSPQIRQSANKQIGAQEQAAVAPVLDAVGSVTQPLSNLGKVAENFVADYVSPTGLAARGMQRFESTKGLGEGLAAANRSIIGMLDPLQLPEFARQVAADPQAVAQGFRDTLGKITDPNATPAERGESLAAWAGIALMAFQGGKVAVGKLKGFYVKQGVPPEVAASVIEGMEPKGGMVDLQSVAKAAKETGFAPEQLKAQMEGPGPIQEPQPARKVPEQPVETPIVEPSAPRTAPKPAEGATPGPTAKPARKPVAEPENTTGLANQVQEREAIKGVLDKVEPAKGRSPEEWQKVGEDHLTANPEFDYEGLAQKIRKGESNLTPENTSILLAGKRRLMAEVSKAASRLAEEPGSDRLQNEYIASQERLQHFVQNVQEGAKGPWSDIGRVFQAGTELDTGSFAQVLAEAERTGPKATPKEVKAWKEQTEQIGKLNAQLEDLKSQLAEAKVGSGRKVRTWDKEAVELEIEDIFKQFADLKGSGGVKAGKQTGAASKITAKDIQMAARRLELVGKLTASYAKLGVANLEELVVNVQAAVKSRLGIDVSRQEVIDSFAPHVGKTMAEAKREYMNLKQQAKRMSTTGQAAREAELNTQIAKLKEQIDSGNFREPTAKERFLTEKQKELEAERDLLSKAVRQKLRDRQKSVLTHVGETGIQAVRGAKLGSDFGMMVRQGLFSLSRPGAYLKGMKAGAEALFSEKAAVNLERDMMDRRIGGKLMRLEWKDAGLSISDSLTHPEELVVIRALRNVPVVGKLFAKPLERGQMAFINAIRTETFNAAYIKGMTPTELKLRAEFINSATGRGNIKQVPKLLQTIMTSPRYEASRWEMIGQAAKNPAIALKSLGRNKAALANVQDMAVTAAGIYALYKTAELAGYSTDFNPESPDFLKLRRGDDVWDVSAGLAPRLRDCLRLFILAQKRMRGEQPEYGQTAGDIIKGSVVRTISPAVRTPIEFATARAQLQGGVKEKDLKSFFTGQKLDKMDYTMWAFAPLIVSSMEQTLESGGTAKDVLWTGAREFVGTGVNQYPKSARYGNMQSVSKLAEPWGISVKPPSMETAKGETSKDYAERVKFTEQYVSDKFKEDLALWKSTHETKTDLDVKKRLQAIQADATKEFRSNHPLPESAKPAPKRSVRL